MMNTKLYQYVGAAAIKQRVNKQFEGKTIHSINDIFDWISETNQRWINDEIIVTFIINLNHQLVIADRHSEHVQCANDKNVWSAGELTLSFDKNKISITDISNQSTGYCPDPASWKYVQIALDNIGIRHPKEFTRAFDFRYCEQCQNTNLIKDAIFECIVCEEALDLEWNIDKMYNF